MDPTQHNLIIRSPADLNTRDREHYEVGRSMEGWFGRASFLERYRVLYPERSEGSIIPSDYCLGRENKGNTRHPRFLKWDGSQYLFVGLGVEALWEPVGERTSVTIQRLPAVEHGHMIDPLPNFEWGTLHARYDAMCKRFNGASAHLDGIDPKPHSDRELYYRLLQAAQEYRIGTGRFTLPQYEALLYWKLYSNPQAMGNLRRWLPSLRRSAGSFDRLLKSLPSDLPREAGCVVELVQSLSAFRLSGIKSATAIPTRTTLLHVFHPSVVPVFDKMVLQAVGIHDRGANQSVEVLRQYLPFAWQLADRHTAALVGFPESPLRLVDMALWVIRNSRPSTRT